MPDPTAPEDVPDDLLDLAKEGWNRHAATAPPGTYTHEGIRRAILAAVLPAHERQVRERVAEQMRTLAGQIGSARSLGMEAAAETLRELADRIARGES